MVSNESLARLPVSAAYQAAPAVAFDADFDTRWATWVARGRIHEQRVRRKLVVVAGFLAMAAAVVYAFMR
jgi:hypothetical protein